MRTCFLSRLALLAPAIHLLCAAMSLAQATPVSLPSAAAPIRLSSGPFLAESREATAPSAVANSLISSSDPARPVITDSGDRALGTSIWNLSSDATELDEGPLRSVVAFVAYDTWRGISDGTWQNNGIHSGLNFGTRLGTFSELTGIGFQIGGSAGAYNWAGTDYRTSHQDMAQPQGFVTYGLFRRASDTSRWSAAVVQDWMLNANFGVFAENPTISQWRGQFGYALSAFNEIGFWGAWRARGDTRFVPFGGNGTASWRSVNQMSVFFHHKWGLFGPDTSLWVGIPEHDRLGGAGSLGDYFIGLTANAPLNDALSVYSLVTYMHPSASAGAAGAMEDSWNFLVGMALYPARNARTSTVVGQRWTPLLPVANNGYFLVDTNNTF